MVAPQRRGLVGVAVEDRADVGQPQAQLAQQQDVLQPPQLGPAVEPDAAVAGVGGPQQTGVVVVPQRP